MKKCTTKCGKCSLKTSKQTKILPVKDIRNDANAIPNRPNKGVFKQSGHYVDQKFKNRYAEKVEHQPSLFEARPELKQIVKDETFVEGINLSASEDRLVNCILKYGQNNSNPDVIGNLPAHIQMSGNKEEEYLDFA